MEKDNKYYNVIENLVKNHKKYNGYDAILDDIIDDVYKHSKTVIDSVKDEDVITSYLQKLVSVSVITVPKRLNFHSELKHRTIQNNEQNLFEIIEPKSKEEEEEEEKKEEEITTVDQIENKPVEIFAEKIQEDDIQKADVNLVNKMINSIDSSSIVEKETDTSEEQDDATFIDEFLTESEFDIEQPEQKDLNNNESDEAGIFELGLENTESEEPELVSAETENFEPEEEPFVNEAETLDIVSDDKETFEPEEESFVSETETLDIVSDEEDTLEPEEEPFVSEAEALDIVSDDEETFEPEEEESFVSETETLDIVSDDEETFEPEEESFVSETETLDIVSDEEDTLEPEEEPLINEVETLDIVSNDEKTFEPEEESFVNETETLDIVSDDEETFGQEEYSFINDSENIELVSEENLIESDEELITDGIDNENLEIGLSNNNYDTALFDNEEGNSLEPELDINNDITLESIGEDTHDNSPVIMEEKPEHNYKPVDYSLFNYVPESKNEDFAIQNIENKLFELNNQKPELNILKIFDLKYKQNLSITEIAEELHVEKQEVISALDEIVDLI